MLVPLYGFVEGDSLGILVLSHSDMTASAVVTRLTDAASVRVDPKGPWALFAKGRELELEKTVEQLELDAFERIDLRRKV